MRAYMAGEHVAGIRVTLLENSATHTPHQGSSFDEFLEEQGIYDDVQAKAINRALVEQASDAQASA